MKCLYCGDCCLRMSPISAPKPCPNLIQDGDFYFCNDYEHRPIECKNHKFNGFRFCPIGMEKLGLKSAIEVSIRIDIGWNKIQCMERIQL